MTGVSHNGDLIKAFKNSFKVNFSIEIVLTKNNYFLLKSKIAQTRRDNVWHLESTSVTLLSQNYAIINANIVNCIRSRKREKFHISAICDDDKNSNDHKKNSEEAEKNVK